MHYTLPLLKAAFDGTHPARYPRQKNGKRKAKGAGGHLAMRFNQGCGKY
jgi:hypothetical protein